MITIEDWSHIRKAKVRHALFCVAYRKAPKGQLRGPNLPDYRKASELQ